jgi:hypothetical protein
MALRLESAADETCAVTDLLRAIRDLLSDPEHQTADYRVGAARERIRRSGAELRQKAAVFLDGWPDAAARVDVLLGQHVDRADNAAANPREKLAQATADMWKSQEQRAFERA